MMFITYWIVVNIIRIDNVVKKIVSDTYLLNQKVFICTDKIKRFVKPKPKKNSKIKYYIIMLIIIDELLFVLYKRKYERLKDIYEFIKNTLA